MKIKMLCWFRFLTLAVVGSMVLFATPAVANETADGAQVVVDNALMTVNDFKADPDLEWFHDNVKNAKGLFVVPGVIRAGLIIGGSSGTGVLLARNKGNGQWSYPAFMTISSASFGLQAGAEKAQVILMIMTAKGMDSMLATSFKMGVDASVAAGPVGVGTKAQTADIISYSRSKGLYGGFSLEGAVVKTRDKVNQAYYDKPVTTSDIITKRKVAHPGADKLIKAVGNLGR